jgi:hypothetical protein
MEYALDINNPRVAQSLVQLGISPEELRILKQEDFSSPKIEEAIAKIRFDYYTKRLKETVSKVKVEIKSVKSRPNLNTISSRATLSPDWDERESIAQLRQKYTKALKLSYQQQKAKFSSKSTQELKISPRAGEDAVQRTPTTKAVTHRERFLERSKKLQADFEKQQKSMYQHQMKTMAKHAENEKTLRMMKMEQHRIKEQEISRRKGEIEGMRRDTDQELDQRALNMLTVLEEKIAKSEESHRQSLKETAEKAAAANRRAYDVFEDQRLQRAQTDHHLVVQKHRKIEEARSRRSLKLKGEEKTLKEKELQHKQRQERITLAKKLEAEKTSELQRKIDQDNHILSQRNSAWQQELRIRRELRRLRHNDLYMKAQRARRVQSSKQYNLLKKHLDDVQRIDDFMMVKSRQAEAFRSRTSLEMLEREKFLKARELLLKTDPGKASGLLKEYELSSESEGDDKDERSK